MDNTIEETTSKSGLLSRLLLVLGSVLLIAAIAIAGYLVWQYLDAQNRYTDIRSVAGLEITFLENVEHGLRLEDLVFDWDALKALNPDIVGWIIVPGTKINYPIVQGRDNEYYLYHLFDASSSGTGAIFADYEGSPTLNGQHNIIYGHNMFDGSMFSDMIMYSTQSFFDEHRTLFLCTPDLNFELSAIAATKVSADAELRQFSFASQEAFVAFMQQSLAAPLAAAPDMQELIGEAESLYSFVTCETFDASTRIILSAVPIRSAVPANKT